MNKKLIAFVLFCQCFCLVQAQNGAKRQTISLNGTWEIGEGKKNVPPSTFKHAIPVPGLVTMASPAFENAAPTIAPFNQDEKKDKNIVTKDLLREAFWYKKTFTVDTNVPSVAVLRIAKAMFGTKVILNGKDLGEHLPSFTSGYFDVKGALKKGKNTLLIGVGADRGALPRSMPDGFDFEKARYIPGIFDKVEILLSGTPNIVTVQTAPDIYNGKVRVQLKLNNSGTTKQSKVQFTVTEAKSGKIVGSLQKEVALVPQSKENLVDVWVPIENSHLWSPEDPFLYSLKVSTEADDYSTRFGMREFTVDTLSKRCMLNGKPYFMRGSNITLLRFVEDDATSHLAFDPKWVRDLHKGFKDFNWNSLRYCIGLPPEFWYEIADEEGFLIQDEFPIWYGGKTWSSWPNELKSDELARQYKEWMQDNWNHPSVVIWDASNETYSPNEEIGKAVKVVRGLDISKRPWDNSYSAMREPIDFYEAHPYHFYKPEFKLKDIVKESPIPYGNDLTNKKTHAVMLNEYGWLWLNRDGTPTTLTEKLYVNLVGKEGTVEQRCHVYATYLAAETEFWRCHRQAAAVLHFTALGYSRPQGQTSDHFADIAKLQYESEFAKYTPDSFSPVGLMLDEWGSAIKAGQTHEFKIKAINDLQSDWNGKVILRILKDGKVVQQSSSPLYIPLYGSADLSITCMGSCRKGNYVVEAVLDSVNGKEVKSIREIVFE
jgi:beta-galactosidase